jgi:hypothetical protein
MSNKPLELRLNLNHGIIMYKQPVNIQEPEALS